MTEKNISEDEKIDLLLRAMDRGVPLERVYRVLLASSVDNALGGQSLCPRGRIP